MAGTRAALLRRAGRAALAGRMRVAGLASLVALALPLPLPVAAQAGGPLDLVEVWRAAERHDREHAVARAAHAAAQPQRDQAAALWRPTVGLVASVGVAGHDTETTGARFGASGFGQSDGVAFATSIDHGVASRWSIAASQPLVNGQRRAQQRQLGLAGDAADVQWRAAGQALMLRTAGRYFELALAGETVRVLHRQREAVQRAATEARDRFRAGDAPVTGTHEANARLAAVQAQVMAAERELQLARAQLADSTGLPPAALDVRLPGGGPAEPAAAVRPLAAWLADAQSGNLAIHGQAIAADIARQEAVRQGRRASASIDLVAQLGRERLSGQGDFGSAANTASNRMIGIQLSVPLVTGGWREAKEAQALRLAEQAAAEVERTREQVAQQVHAAWLGLSVGAGRVGALEQALVASQARRAATGIGRDVGERTTLDLLDAVSESAAAELALARARVDLLMDRLRLAALVARLDEAALREVQAR